MREGRRRDVMAAVLIGVLSVLIGSACSPAPTNDQGDDGGGGNGYYDTYGGSQAVYDRIAALTDCDALQHEFDVAAANNDAAEPGTSQHRQTTGYMAAADDRMRAVGCY